MTFVLPPWLGISAVLVLLGSVIGGLKLVRQRVTMHPETSRKIVHVLMGLVTLTFPWVFQEIWPVLVLAGIALGLMLVLRFVPVMRRTFGGVLHDIERESLGDLCYPVGVATLFVLSEGDPIRYVIPILLLGIADAAAALIGVEYGKKTYRATEGTKSAEGSIAFFTVAFFSTHIPLLLFTETGRLESLLIGTIVGLLMMMVEAISWRGLDNLFVPLGAFALLHTHLELDATSLLIRLIVILALMTLLVVYQGRTTLSDSALLGATLVGFVIWSVGGWIWLVAPLTLFLLYTRLWPQTTQTTHNKHNTHVVFSVNAIGLIWIFLAVALKYPGLLYPYTVSYAAYLAVIGTTQLKHATSDRSFWNILLDSTLKSWLLLFLPYILLMGLRAASGLEVGAALLLIALAVFVAHRIHPTTSDYLADPWRWRWQSAVVGGVSVLAMVLMTVG